MSNGLSNSLTLGVTALAAVTGLGAYLLYGKKKASSKPVLTYFDGRGLGEVIRLLLADAQVDFDDIRLTRQKFDEVKASGVLPYGQVPILEVGDLKIAQSGAIIRYLAREYDYYGANTAEAALIDGVLDCVATDIRPAFFRLSSSDITEEKKAELKIKFTNETLPRFIAVFETMLKHNHGGTGYIVGNKMSVADLVLFDLFASILQNYPNALADFPLCKALIERVAHRPRLAAYLAQRKETPF